MLQAIFFAFLFLFSSLALSDVTLTDENGLGFDEKRIGDIIKLDKFGNPIFLGGTPAAQRSGTEVNRGTKSIAGEFPTSGWVGNCTGNAVALDVIVTAGHCKGTGARISFAHRESGKSYSATCTRHPRYNTRTIYNDFTLCKLDKPLPVGSKLLTFVKARLPVGTDMWVNGFGAPNVGTHYWGTAKISGTSGSQDIMTCGPATLGGGDSGGSLIVKFGERSLLAGGDATGVNSRGNNSCDWYNDYAHSEFQSWAREYETKNGVKLCGISTDCPVPVDAEPPMGCEALYRHLGVCIIEKGTLKTGCMKAYADFGVCIAD